MASTARLDELKKKFDENPRRYFAPLANEHRKSGDLESAIALCRAHLPQQPAHISGHIVLGQALFEAGQPDESRATFQTALELDPENLIALRYLGDIARNDGDVPTARVWYERVLEVDPRNEEIATLIRDLDAPTSVDEPIEAEATTANTASTADTAASEAPAEEPVAGAPLAAAPAASAPDDSRFAPLSFEHIDTGEDLFTAPAESPEATAGASAGMASEWSTESPTMDMSLLDEAAVDEPEIDPFDMPATASAESLLDAVPSVGGAATEPLLSEYATDTDAIDIGDLEAAPHGSDSWPETSEAEPSRANAAPTNESFDEGSFYVDAAFEPAAASPAPAEDVAAVHAAHNEFDVLDAEAAVEQETPGEADADAGNDPAVAATSEADTGLGLEPMEFVPPSAADAPVTVMEGMTTGDPLTGREPELGSAPASATPAAFVTETMAELYLQQGFRNEALAVYRELLARNPADASLRDRIEQIESGSMSSIGMASVSEDVVESALRRQTSRPGKSVRSFFASFAARRAPEPSHREPVEASEQHSDDDAVAGFSRDASSDEPPAYGLESYGVQSDGLDSYDMPNAGTDAASPGAEPPAPTAMRSAAEQMAEFDPFADAWGAPAPAPNESQPAPDAGARFGAVDPAAPSSRSLEHLFPQTSSTPRADAAAAETLANAFGRDEPQGRPTRAANNELSLDRVFRGAPDGAPAPDGSFSFDQFFSDTRSSAGDPGSAPVASPAAESASEGGNSDTHDIEQFTAWLEGLKKK